jgi:hypothetical protein
MRNNLFLLFPLILLFFLWFIAKLFSIDLRGLYSGYLIGSLFFLFRKNFSKFYEVIFVSIALANILILGWNTFFHSVVYLPPVFGNGEFTYEKFIQRSISLLGNEFRLRRSTGFVDNIHVSAFLNLLLIFYLYYKKTPFLYYFSIIILALNLNFQFILIFLFWLFLRNRTTNFSFIKIIFYFFSGIFLFYFIDKILLSGSYVEQIGVTNFNLLYQEFLKYLNFMKLQDWIFGFNNLFEDFYQGSVKEYSIPLTDIGFIGILIQYGIVGTFFIVIYYFVWFKLAYKEFKLFLSICLIMFLHYFTLASFWSILMIFLLLGFQKNLFKKNNA